MTTPNSRIPANQVGLVFALLLAVWLAFTFIRRIEKPAPAAAPVVAESKLHAVGLEDNPDWEGMPEIFAIWADHAEWQDGKTRFAYWHPGTKTYSYYFEAVRISGGFRFKETPEAPTSENGNYWDQSLGEDCPIRFYRSPEIKKSSSQQAPAKPVMDRKKPERLPVEIPRKELKTVPVNPPPKP